MSVISFMLEVGQLLCLFLIAGTLGHINDEVRLNRIHTSRVVEEMKRTKHGR